MASLTTPLDGTISSPPLPQTGVSSGSESDSLRSDSSSSVSTNNTPIATPPSPSMLGAPKIIRSKSAGPRLSGHFSPTCDTTFPDLSPIAQYPEPPRKEADGVLARITQAFAIRSDQED